MTVLVALAVAAAHEAGELLRSRFRTPQTGVATKSSATDLVTDTDRDAERLLVERIRGARPHDQILAEEGGAMPGDSGLSWALDPLDGTINFFFGIPHFSVSLACADSTGPLLGVVHDPLREETFVAERGGGAMLEGRTLHVSDDAVLEQALVATGFSYREQVRSRQAATLALVLPRIRDIRRYGSAALDLAWTAAGRFHAFYESPLQPWDRMAGCLLVEEAGGRVTELREGGVLASGQHLHDALLRLLTT